MSYDSYERNGQNNTKQQTSRNFSPSRAGFSPLVFLAPLRQCCRTIGLTPAGGAVDGCWDSCIISGDHIRRLGSQNHQISLMFCAIYHTYTQSTHGFSMDFPCDLPSNLLILLYPTLKHRSQGTVKVGLSAASSIGN